MRLRWVANTKDLQNIPINRLFQTDKNTLRVPALVMDIKSIRE